MKKKCNLLKLTFVLTILNYCVSAQTVQVPAAAACTPITPVPNKPFKFACDHFGTAIVDVTLPDGSVWMDRNMGALRAAQFDEDLMAMGCLYQYGRKPDGSQETHYYQPQNWGNGYPTTYLVNGVGAKKHVVAAGDMLSNGYSVYPYLGSGDVRNGFPVYFMGQYLNPGGTNLTYTQTIGSTPALQISNIPLSTPTQDWSPNAVRYNTGIGNTFWTDYTTYPANVYYPQLWGGDVALQDDGGNNPTYHSVPNTVAKASWGKELNPVCPVGYHVPTRDEWASALTSIMAAVGAANYTTPDPIGQWTKSALKLPVGLPFTGAGYDLTYWTSSPWGMSSQAAAYNVVAFSTYVNNYDGRIGYDLQVGGLLCGPTAPGWGGSNGLLAVDKNLYVRCRKNQ